jgi:hypothetical protein
LTPEKQAFEFFYRLAFRKKAELGIKKNGQWSEPYTWHHHQDGESMMPVLQTVHQSIQNYHTGGRSISNRGLKGLFDPPLLELMRRS